MRTAILTMAMRFATAPLAAILLTTPSRSISVTPLPPASFDQIVLPVGKGPGAIAIADVNHDGKLGLLVENETSQTLTVLLGDGNLDLVIANTQTPYLTILLGDGKGGFKPSPHSPFATQSYPHVHGVAAADFNGDGKLDVVTDSWGHDQILMLLGDGAGNLILPGQLFNTGKRPYQRLRSADFNKDGKPDVVTTDMDINAVSILLGDGKGGFHDAPGSPFPAGVVPWAVAIDDMNKDGNLDLVVIPYDRDVTDPKQLGVTVLLGDGKGAFTKMPGSPLPLAGCRGPNHVVTGDLSGDGFRDIVVSCAQNNRLMLFMSSKDGTFQVSTRDVQTGWSGLAIADLNGDGKDDIVVSNNESGTITILFGK